MTALTAENLAELRRLLDDMRVLANREGIYSGNRAVLDIIGRVEPLLDAAAERDALAALRAAAEAIARAYRARAECAEGLLVSLANRAAEDRAEIEALRSQLAERDALAAKVERVRALHRPAYNDAARSPMCEDCGGKAGVHPCGCWADDDYEFVCAVCNQGTKNQSVPWPCPTVRALDGEPQP